MSLDWDKIAEEVASTRNQLQEHGCPCGGEIEWHSQYLGKPSGVWCDVIEHRCTKCRKIYEATVPVKHLNDLTKILKEQQ
jgi:hypothetical protein